MLTRDTMPSSRSDVRALLERWSEAIRRKDIDRLMSLYSPDIVYFDVVSPLRYRGLAELRRDFLRWFDGWESDIRVEVRTLSILANVEVAAIAMLHRTSGVLKDGRDVGYWVRATICCKRSQAEWLIAHEHISLPVDFPGGRAAMDLMP